MQAGVFKGDLVRSCHVATGPLFPFWRFSLRAARTPQGLLFLLTRAASREGSWEDFPGNAGCCSPQEPTAQCWAATTWPVSISLLQPPPSCSSLLNLLPHVPPAHGAVKLMSLETTKRITPSHDSPHCLLPLQGFCSPSGASLPAPGSCSLQEVGPAVPADICCLLLVKTQRVAYSRSS